jgi:Ca2+-binding RTX toxin-like protein
VGLLPVGKVLRLPLYSVVAVAIMSALFATAAYADIITGTNREDWLTGTDERDHINALGAHDVLIGRGDDDDLHGGRGPDDVIGSNGDDDLTGGRAEDLLVGQRGDDVINAHDGFKDDVRCGSGVDVAYVDDTEEVADLVSGGCEVINGEDNEY